MILAIGAHIDDVELKCSGTLLRYKGKKCLVICSDSSSRGKTKQRIREQYRASELIGYDEVFFLNFEDGYLRADRELVTELDRIIKLVKPKFIYTHSEDDTHNDHSAVGRAVRSANRYHNINLVRFPSSDNKQAFNANLIVDVSGQYEDKLKVLGCFKSQHDVPAFHNPSVEEKFYLEYMRC